MKFETCGSIIKNVIIDKMTGHSRRDVEENGKIIIKTCRGDLLSVLLHRLLPLLSLWF